MKKHGRYLTKAHSYKVKVWNLYIGSQHYPGEWSLLLVLEGLEKKRTHSIIKKNMEKIVKAKNIRFEYQVQT